MRVVIYCFGSGAAFFAGAALVIAAIALAWSRKRVAQMFCRLVAIVGVLLVGLSAVPLPWWALGVLAGWIAVWAVVEALVPSRGVRISGRILGLVLFLTAIGWEGSYLVPPALPALDHPTLFVVGDSVSAGLGQRGVETWPQILAKGHGIDVRDQSHPGETTASALRRLQQQPVGDGIVLAQIGGNDLLGSTSLADFEASLDRLLAALCAGDRTVLLFELPLPPGCNEWGLVQRRLAARHGVLLIPRHYFIGVLTRVDATVDSVHLTASGQKAMSELVWELISPAYR